MGRRKIEIQPITHERNRSVTFLKRKNGLFKKAYELGVLCSVDVAVIIFEERPGHHVKLYQYCSGDVHDIVQRHMRYDGEHDTRTPHDFANNANNIKADDTADVDDDDGDDDEHDSRHPVKRGANLKLKQEHANGKNASDADLASVDVDYGMHRPVAIPGPPMHLHASSHLQSTASGPSLPLSTERQTSNRSSLSANGSAGKLSGDESLLNGYLPSPTSVQSPAYRHNGPQLPYTSYIGSPSSTVLPPSSYEFPPPPSSSSRGAPRNGLYSQRSATYAGHDQMSGMYHHHPHPHPHPHPLMRQTLPHAPSHPHATHPSSSSLHPHPQPQPQNELLYPALLDPADDPNHPSPHQHHQPHQQQQQQQQHHQQHHQHQRQMPSSQQPHFPALDWPTHGPATSTPSHQTPPHGSAAGGPRQDPTAATAAGSTGENTNTWLDFLSQNAPGHGPPPHQMPLSLPSAEREYAAAEREVVGVVVSDKLGNGGMGGGGGGGGGVVMSSPSSRKRPRTSSGMAISEDGRRHHSPQGLSGVVVGRKKEEGH